MAKQSEATLLLRIKQVGQDVLDRVVFTFGDLVNVAKAVAGALQEPLRAWREQELATNQLNTALVNQGIYTSKLSKDYAEMADALAKTTLYEDNAILAAQAQLQAYLGQTKVTEGLTKAVLDLAAAKGMDLASAADLVGKTIGTATNALGRHGIEVDANASKQEKLAQVIAQINSRWKDQANTAASGAGVFENLHKSFGELQEALGQRLSPILEKVAQNFKAFIDDSSRLTPVLDTLGSALLMLVKSGDIVYTFFQTLGNAIGALGAAITTVVTGLSNPRQMWAQLKEINSAANAEAESMKQAHLARMASYDAAASGNSEAQRLKEEELKRQSLLRQHQIEEEHRLAKGEKKTVDQQSELAQQAAHDELMRQQQLVAQITRLDEQIANEQLATQKLKLEQQRRVLEQQVTNDKLLQSERDKAAEEKALKAAQLQDQTRFFGTVAQLSATNSKELQDIAKAAAIAQIAMKTPQAVASSYAFGAGIGGPLLGAAFAGIAASAMAAQAAQVAGVKLAEGGIVRATPGGIQATIGEGGRDEAVIPLDSPEAAGRLGGGPVTINFNGPVMGDESQAREFARAVDRQLMKLRRDGESLAFDERLT